MPFKISSIWVGIIVGALVSVAFGSVYFIVLHEPGSVYYLFAGLTFFGGSLLGGIVAVLRTREHKRRVFFSSGGAVFGIVFVLFVLMYVVSPQFARTSVQLPDFCDGFDGSFDPPPHLTYTLPTGEIGILITSDAEFAVVAQIDHEHPPFSSTVFLVNKNENAIIQSMRFNNDVVSASIDDGIAYIYNDKLGYLLGANSGKFQENILIIDNYGGLSESDRPFFLRPSTGHWYMETSAIISSWNVDGTVKSRPHLTFNGIALGCYISGNTGDVTQY